MASEIDRRLNPAEVELVLRRAAELNARRQDQSYTISTEVLIQVAAAAGIPERDVRRALRDVYSEEAEEAHSLATRLYGPVKVRTVREIEQSVDSVLEYLEYLLRREQGLKLRRKTAASSLWDAGDILGPMRRMLDFSGQRPLQRARCVELQVEPVEKERSHVSITADVSGQRAENLWAGGILGATLAVPLAIAGFADAWFFLFVLPALAAPGLGFKLAYHKARSDMRLVLEHLLDAAESGPPPEGGEQRERDRDRPKGQIKTLKPIPRFTSGVSEEERSSDS